MEGQENLCVVCHKLFKRRSHLYAHLRNVHKIEPGIQGKIICPDSCCVASFKDYSGLRSHMSSSHKLQIDKEIHIFYNKADFFKWKEQTEKETKSFFTKKNNKCLAVGRNKSYYICHRSGFKQTATHSHTRPPKNLFKMGSHCPSTMEVWEEENRIHAVYYPNHFGHERELKYLLMSKSERAALAKKLSEGVSMDACLNDAHNSVTDDLERIHLITKRDLRNIRNAKGVLQEERQDVNDDDSIALWVKEDKESQRNLTIFYKPQGSPCFPLEEKDLMLVIMSPPQKEIYKKFCGAKICVDSTHGTNSYVFQFTAIMVVDEFGTGLPIAFCLSNRVDQCAMEIFFDAVAKATTTTTPDVFMSDDVPEFYDAWKEVNGEAKCQLICPWHVERNWRKALSKISSKKKSKTTLSEKKVNVYKQARTLLEETDMDTFQMQLKDFLHELEAEDETKRFGIYFENIYANRPETWAVCYRPDCEKNTNMYLEVMHKVLNECKQIVQCLSCLLIMARDKILTRFIQLIESGESSKIDIVHDRHQKSLYLSSTIEVVNSTTWKISSSNQSSANAFRVLKVADDCNNCLLKCFYCQGCVHMYYCTCNDYNVEFNMCKHIHFVLSKQSNALDALMGEEVSFTTEIEEENETWITPNTTMEDFQSKFKDDFTANEDDEIPESTTEDLEHNFDPDLIVIRDNQTSTTEGLQCEFDPALTVIQDNQTPTSTTEDLQHEFGPTFTVIQDNQTSTTEDLQRKFDHALTVIQGNEYDTETRDKLNKLMDTAISLLNSNSKRKIDTQDEDVKEPSNKTLKLLPFIFMNH